MGTQILYSESSAWPDAIENTTDSVNSGNHTILYPSELLDVAAFCLSIITIVGVSGNIISILALLKVYKLRNATTAFVINLALADLIFCSFSCPLLAVTFASKHRIYEEGALCTLFVFISYSNLLVSVFTVVAITINRYVCIVHSSFYARIYRPRNVAIMIAILWLSSFVMLSLPLFEVWGRFGPIPEGLSCDILTLNEKSPKITVLSAILALPTISFILCYSQIYCVVRKVTREIGELDEAVTPYVGRRSGECSTNDAHQSMNFCSTTYVQKSKDISRISRVEKTVHRLYSLTQRKNSTPGAESSESKRRKDLRVLKVTFIIFIAYVVCYFPGCVIQISGKDEVGKVPTVAAYVMAFLANCINPLIYVALSDEYRKACFLLFGCNNSDSQKTNTKLGDSQDLRMASSSHHESSK